MHRYLLTTRAWTIVEIGWNGWRRYIAKQIDSLALFHPLTWYAQVQPRSGCLDGYFLEEPFRIFVPYLPTISPLKIETQTLSSVKSLRQSLWNAT